MSGKRKILQNGIISQNPVLVLLLGACPALAVTTTATNALGMGAAATFVLLCANTSVSLLRKVIPDKVRIPCYIVLIAGFVTIVEMVVRAYAYSLYQSLGVFLPLIVVNCMILGRAEMFARRNNVLDSVADAVGMGLGFTLALFGMAAIREIFGGGTLFDIKLPVLADNRIGIFTLAPGGFIAFGLMIAIMNLITKGNAPRKTEFGCEGCPSAGSCASFSGATGATSASGAAGGEGCGK